MHKVATRELPAGDECVADNLISKGGRKNWRQNRVAGTTLGRAPAMEFIIRRVRGKERHQECRYVLHLDALTGRERRHPTAARWESRRPHGAAQNIKSDGKPPGIHTLAAHASA